MTTHARYLREYPKRIALKRAKRRKKAMSAKASKRNDIRHFREVLREAIASRPPLQQVRAGEKKAWHEPITRFLRRTPA